MAGMAYTMQKERGWARFCSGQMYYSLVGRDLEHEFVPMLKATGMTMTVWSPLAGGFLSGKYTRESLKDRENRLSGFDFIPIDKEAGFRLIEQMREIGKAHGASVAQVALAWLLARPWISSVIVGASKLEQLEDNLKAIDLQLTPAQMQMLDKAFEPKPIYPNWFTTMTADPAHSNA
jgi:aryl-alcohol dehydrogenase-like predicted oxidoreductase